MAVVPLPVAKVDNSTVKTRRTVEELLELVPDAGMIVDRDSTLVLVNTALARMFGYPREALRGDRLDRLLPQALHTKHQQHVRDFFSSAANRPMGHGFRFLGVRANGEEFHVEIMLSHFSLDDETYAMAFVRDTTALKLTEEKIRRELEQERTLALTDHLTGLGNRRAFTLELEEDLAELSQHGWQFAVCFIDLDDFKLVNDTYGHAFGDKVLQDIARLIRAGCRSTDFVARIGGDEFATIHPSASLEDAMLVLERVRASIVQELHEQHWPVTLSMGICHCNERDHSHTIREILGAADKAMYEAKKQGKNRIEIAKL